MALVRIGVALAMLLSMSWAQGAWWHKPPGVPESGYGSSQVYITDGFDEYQFGSGDGGDLTWYYVPHKLKYDTSAPVVIFLHGFSALIPKFYESHIKHLLYQGNIVIFPQFQRSSISGFLAEAGLLAPADQNIWARRAVASVDQALEELGELVQGQEIYLYGHSLGGLIALAWQAEGGIQPAAAMLAHPQVNSQEGIPSFVQVFLTIIEIPWRDYVGDINFPVVLLNGNSDSIAPVEQSRDILAALASAPSKELYIAQRDCYGYPCLSPNHGAALDRIPVLPPNLEVFSISAELNALDWRYYFAGLDALLDGYRTGLPFDLGQWSNGTPVLPLAIEVGQ